MKVTATTNNKKMNFKKITKGAQLSDDREGCNGGMVGGDMSICIADSRCTAGTDTLL